MPADLEKIANIFGQDTIKKIYDDAASQPIQEGSKALTDLVKALRFFTAPIQFLGAYQDRLTKFLDRVRANVKEENQIEAPASISGPVIERLKYQEEGNPLTELYLNLLSRAIDKERIQDAHPAFYHIIDQLSADEAMILYLISQDPIKYDYTMDLYIDDKRRYRFKNTKIKHSTIPHDKLVFKEHFDMYIRHLESLNLVFWKKVNEEPIKDQQNTQIGTDIQTVIELTDFGYLFVKACIPEKGFIIIKNAN
jgi:hypothetical protein